MQPTVSLRARKVFLAIAIVMQTVYFFAFMDRPLAVVSDNRNYETPAWRMVSGHGLSLSYEENPDRAVREWVCTRHPDACVAGLYPSALYPPGYTVFIAGHYVLFGRTLWPLAASHLLLLIAFCFIAERLAFRLSGKLGHAFVMITLALYPFIGRQAAILQSDHLHLVLVAASIWAWVELAPGIRRGVAFGVLIAFATLVRPYTALTVPIVFLWPSLWRENQAGIREWLGAAVGVFVPCFAWIARNFYWFGRFIPFSTTGLGATLYSVSLEAQGVTVYGDAGSGRYWGDLMKYGNPVYYDANVALGRDGSAWIKAHPLETAWVVLQHVPKTWISLGADGQALGIKSLALAAYLGGLLLLGVVGMWMSRRDRRLGLMRVLVLTYWAFLLQSPEARRSLPLRLPMLIFAAVAVERIAKVRGRTSKAALDNSAA